MPDTVNFNWKGKDLHYGKGKNPVVSVEQDKKYPTMWRVRMPDGTLSDMANLTWAKDAALSYADRFLRTCVGITVAPPALSNGEGAIGVAKENKTHQRPRRAPAVSSS